MKSPDIPRLLAAYEKRVGVSLTAHDYSGGLAAHIPPVYFLHDRNPWCRAVKAVHRDRCGAFDLTRLQGELGEHPHGGWKRCAAGYLEAFHPVFVSQRIAGVLFAGVFSPQERDLSVALDALQGKAARTGKAELPPPLSGESMAEHLLLLGLLAEAVGRACEANHAESRSHVGRREQIEGFLAHRYDKNIALPELCAWLGLNPSRTSELLRTLYGKTFPDLVNERRLAQAKRLLSETALPVHFIASQCGYASPEYFFRVFRKACGRTPLAWRKRAAKGGGRGSF